MNYRIIIGNLIKPLNIMALLFFGFNVVIRSLSIHDSGIATAAVVALFIVCGAVLFFPRYLHYLLFVFAFFFSFFGFPPYSIKSQYFELIISAVALTILFINLRDAPAPRNRHIMILLLCYISVSLFSLFLLPLKSIASDIYSIGLIHWSFLVFDATADNYLYSVAGVNRLILFFLLVVQISGFKDARRAYSYMFVGLFCSAVFSAVIGLASFYGLISLNWYRVEWMPWVVSSLFENRGHFAQFIMVVSPFVLMGFLKKKTLAWRICLFSSLIVCEIALILAGARAGWVSYPLVLFFCWAFVYLFREDKPVLSQLNWKAFIKTVVFMPVTLLISIFIIFQAFPFLSHVLNSFAKTESATVQKGAVDRGVQGSLQVLDASQKGKVDKGILAIESRASDLFDQSDRTSLWKLGFNIGRENPLLGMGYDSFRWQSMMLGSIPDSYFKKGYQSYTPDALYAVSAHNTFLQLFVNGGVIGLSLWAMLIGYILIIMVMDLIKNDNLLNIPVIVSVVVSHIHGVFLDLQFIPMIWMIVFLLIGYALTIKEEVLPHWIQRSMGIVLKACVLVVLISGFLYYERSSYAFIKDEYNVKEYPIDQNLGRYMGFSDAVTLPDGNYRWSRKRALMKFSGSGRAELILGCLYPDVAANPVVLRITLDGRDIVATRFNQDEWVRMRLVIPGTADTAHKLYFTVSRTWVPVRYGINTDMRTLGIAVSEIRFIKQ